jgi:hypothetical protein
LIQKRLLSRHYPVAIARDDSRVFEMHRKAHEESFISNSVQAIVLNEPVLNKMLFGDYSGIVN